MSDTHKAIVEKVNEAFRNNSIEGFLQHCADDVSWTMVGDRAVNGKDAIRQWMSGGPPEAPQFTVDAVISEGDRVVAYGDMTMKEEGETVPYGYCDVYRFRGDKIVELKAFVIKTGAAAAAV